MPTVMEPKREETVLWDATFGWFLALFFLFNVGLGVFPPLLPQIMGDLGLTFAAAGMLGSAFGLFRFLVDLPAGFFAERLGIPLILHGAAGLLLAGTALSAWADGFWAMFAARALLGLGSGMAMVFAILYLMRRGAAGHRNRRANLYEGAVIAGMAVSAEMGGLIASRWGWRWSFGLAAVVFMLAWAVVTWKVLPGMRDLMREGSQPDAVPVRERSVASLGPTFTIYLLIFGQAFAWGGGISTLLPLFGGEALHLTPEIIGRIMAIAFWVEVCLLFPVGWVADVLGKVRVVVPGFLAMLVGILSAPLMQGVWGYGVTFVFLVSGMSVWMAAPALHAERLTEGFRGKAAGLYRLVTDLGFIVAPGAVGWLIGRYGFVAGACPIAVVLIASILMALCFLRVRRLVHG
jgi:DHA1 family multidrug resistance protein-like MFS transporter